jgi:FMN phosphatase YigB (HAD superfamily)
MNYSQLVYICDNARHLVCIPYSVDNLHAMAQNLGIKRCWFHGDHYDIPKGRVESVKAQCHRVVASRDIVRIVKGTYV